MDSYDVIARFYDCEHQDFSDDIDFYLQLIQQGPVLEIGVGTGRIMAPLLRSGLEAWGVDSSRRMLEIAAGRLDRSHKSRLVHASVEDLDLPTRFPFVIVPLNTLWHLTTLDRQLLALTSIRRHLAADGLVVIDLSNPVNLADRKSSGEMRLRFDRVCEGSRIVCTSAAWDDEASQLLELSLSYDVIGADGAMQRFPARLSLRYTFRYELELLLRLADLRPRHIYGSYDLEPYEAGSPRLIVLASRAP